MNQSNPSNHPLLSEMRKVILGSANPNPTDPHWSSVNNWLAYSGRTEVFVRAFELAEYDQALSDLIERYYHSNSMTDCKAIFEEIDAMVRKHSPKFRSMEEIASDDIKHLEDKRIGEEIWASLPDNELRSALAIKNSLSHDPYQEHFNTLFSCRERRKRDILFDMAKAMDPNKLALAALRSYQQKGDQDRLELIERILVECGSKADKVLWFLADLEGDFTKETFNETIAKLEDEIASAKKPEKGERMVEALQQLTPYTKPKQPIVEPITSHPKSYLGANSYCKSCKTFFPTSKPIADFKCVHCSPTGKESSALPKLAMHLEPCFFCDKKFNFYGYSFDEHPSNYVCETCSKNSKEDPEFVNEQYHYRDFPYQPGHQWYNGKQFYDGKSWFVECKKCGILDKKPMKWFEKVAIAMGRNRVETFDPEPSLLWNGYDTCLMVKELKKAKQLKESWAALEKERAEKAAKAKEEQARFLATEKGFMETFAEGYYWISIQTRRKPIIAEFVHRRGDMVASHWFFDGSGCGWNTDGLKVLDGPLMAPSTNVPLPKQPEDTMVATSDHSNGLNEQLRYQNQ